ncbi:hypothetical protein BHE74_00051278, partial [Ensete ventricosum]
MFDRAANLTNNQIINYKCDPTEKWLVLIGIAPGAPEVSLELFTEVDFDRCQPILGGISRGRKKKREKKRENLEIRCCSPNPDPSFTGFSTLRGENLRRSRGEANDAGFSLRLRGEKKCLPAWGEGTRR